MQPLLILSGASRGIGRAIAERALDRGFAVGALARTEADLVSLAALAPERVEVTVADVRDQAAVAAGVQAAIARFGSPTLVVAAAGSLGPIDRPWLLPAAELDDVLAVTVTGAANLASATVPAMRDAGRGTFVAVSASSATRVFPGWAAYGAAKAGLDAYVRYLAEEAGEELTAFSFVPGLTDTAMQEGLRDVDPERFPQVEQFRRWHERGVGKAPAVVAEALELALALPRAEVQGQIVEADALLKARAQAARRADA
jgi:NAD(P)-dependent dehydrogenase (short-subunit alcohol dehydrogenase family)